MKPKEFEGKQCRIVEIGKQDGFYEWKNFIGVTGKASVVGKSNVQRGYIACSFKEDGSDECPLYFCAVKLELIS